MSNDFNDVINLLKKSANEKTYDIWVPSLERDVKFKHFTAAIHKKFIKILMDANIFNTALNITIFETIKATCAEPEVDIGSLNVFDKIAICAGLRANNFSKDISVDLSDNTVSAVTNEALLLSTVKNYTVVGDQTFTFNDIKIVCGVPTLKIEKDFDTYIHNKHLINFKREDLNQVNTILADLVLYGVSQYIKTISIGEKTVTFADLKTDNKIEILNIIDTTLIAKLSEFIQKCNDVRTKMMTVTITNGDISDNIEVTLDASLFVEE